MTVSFERPYFLFAAVIIIPIIFIFSRRFKSLFTLDLPLGPPGGIPFKPPLNIGFLMKILRGFELAGVLFLWIAAAGPRFVYTETIWLSRGADIFFVLDISPSMAGLDMDSRSRFDTARELLKGFADMRPQDAIGLVTVGEDAALVAPLTTDRDALYSRLDGMVIGELGDGTALGLGLATAALHIGRSGAPRKAVVLITDGENNAGSVHPETAAALLGDMGISLWVIGVGSNGQVPINYVDPVTRIRRVGSFESGYNPENLKAIAEKGRGNFIAAPQAGAFASAFARVDQGEMTVRRSGLLRRTEPFYAFFVLSAMVLLCGVYFVKCFIFGALI